MSFDKDMIKVFNYSGSGVSLPTKEGGVFFGRCEDIAYPVMEIMTLSDLEYVNTHTTAIRSGIVEFEEEERDEIYKALRLPKWREFCFFERDIDDMLINANYETMDRVLRVNDITTIDRIYGHMTRLIASGAYDVSTRVKKLVEGRRSELYRDIMTTRIHLVQKKKEVPAIPEEEVAKLVAEQVAAQMALLTQKEEKTEPKKEDKKSTSKKTATKTARKSGDKKTTASTVKKKAE